MDDWPIPVDDEDFELAKDQLVEEFVADGGALHATTAAQLLDLKWRYLDGDLVDWSTSDVDTVLFELFPRSVVVPPERVHLVPEDVATFMRFLGRHRPDPWIAQGLARRVEESTQRFVAAMRDDRNWATGKRVWSKAFDDGVDLSDQRAMRAWVDDFNERPLPERDRIVGRMMGSKPSNDGLPALPVRRLPSDESLAHCAKEAPLVQKLSAFVRFVGDGCQLTATQSLKLADARQLVDLLRTGDQFDPQIGDRVFKTQSSSRLPVLDFLFRLALVMGMLELDCRKVRRGPNGSWVDSAPLDIVYASLRTLLTDHGPTYHRLSRVGYEPIWYAEVLDLYLMPALYAMYLHDRPWTFAEHVDGAWEMLAEAHDLGGMSAIERNFERGSVERSLRRAFDWFEWLGVVAVDGVTETTDKWGFPVRSGGTATLTPLGLWAVKRVDSR